MVSQIGDIVERLNCLHVWPQSIASTYADTLTPRQIERLYDVGNVATEAASTIATLRKQLAAQDRLVEALESAEVILSRYANYLDEISYHELEMHPYIPNVQQTRDDVRKALSAIKEQHRD